MENEEKKINKLIPGMVIGLLVGVGATIGCFAYDHMKEEKQPEESKVSIEALKETKEYKETNMIEMFKEYYTSKGFVMTSNVNTWDVEIKEETDEYVVFESTYTCKDKTGSCIYVSQEEKKDDKYIFTIKANGKYENYKFNITSIEGPATEEKKEEKPSTPVEQPSTQTQQPVKESTELDYNTYSQLLLEYLTSKGLIFKPNLNMFRPESFTYKGYYASKPNEKWYEVHGYYTCLDGESDCVYQEQGGEEDNGAYTFGFHITVSDGQIVDISGMGITEGLIK